MRVLDWKKCFSSFLLGFLVFTSGLWAQASLSIVKQAKLGANPINTVRIGEGFYYSIRFEASASGDDAMNVVLSDTLPSNLVFLGTGGDANKLTDGGAYDASRHTVTWRMKESLLRTGQTVEVFLDVKFRHGETCPGDVAANQSVLSADNAAKVVSAEILVYAAVTQPVISLTKARVVECPVVETGLQRYNITLLINNNITGPYPERQVHIGSQNFTNIVVKDYLPAGAEVVDAGGGTVDGNSVTWDLGPYLINPVTGVATIYPGYPALGQYYYFGNYYRTFSIFVRFPGTSFSAGQSVTNQSEVIITRQCLGDTSLTRSVSHALCTAGARGVCNKNLRYGRSERTFPIHFTNNMALSFTNSGNVTMDSLVWFDAIPAPFKLLNFNQIIGSDGAEPAPPLYIQYKTNLNDWRDLSGGPFGRGAANMNFNLPAGEMVDSIRCIAAAPVPPGSAYSVLFGYKILETDRNGYAVEIGQRVDNCMEGFYIYDGVRRYFSCCDYIFIGPLWAAEVTLRKTLVSPMPPTYPAQGDAIRFSITFNFLRGTQLDGYDVLENPVFADLLPPASELVSWSINGGLTPLFSQIENYKGTGRTLLLWSFTGSGAKTFDTPYTGFTLTTYIRLTGMALNGTKRNEIYLISSENRAGFRSDRGLNNDFARNVRDVLDLDDDGDSNEMIVYNYADVNARGTTEYKGTKSIRSRFDADWVIYPNLSRNIPGTWFDYRLALTNTGAAPLDSIDIVDILPHIGDVDVSGGAGRGSQWSPILAEPLSLPAGWTVFYSTSGNPDRPEFGVSGDYPAWNVTPPGDLSTVKSIRLIGDFRSSLFVAGQTLGLNMRMRAPEDAAREVAAWNSFAIRGHDGESWGLVTEPLKAGALVAGSTLNKDNGVEVMEARSEYTYTISYTSPLDLTEAFLEDHLPACLEYVSSMPTAAIQPGGIVTWNLGNLTRGQSGSLSLTVRVRPDCYAEEVENCVEFYAYDRENNRVDFAAACDKDRVLNAGTIGDRVWYDLDGEGDQDAGENGIPGVIVHLVDANGDTVAADTTDGSGQYLFAKVLPGTYEVTVAASSLPANHTLTGGADPHAVELNPGEEYLEADFGYQPQPGSIGDYVWYDLDGEGDQDGSEPGIGGVIVYLIDAAGDTVARDTTAASGRYLFVEIAPGSYTVIVDGTTLPLFHHLSGGTEPHELVLPAGGSYLDADFGYEPDPGEIGDYVWHDINGDFVQDGGEKGISGARLYLVNASGDTVAVTQTDADGLYRFTEVRPGSYRVHLNTGTIPPTYSATGGSNPLSVDLSPGEIYLEADFGYRAVGLIGDYVWLDLNGDGVQDPEETGIPGMVLRLYDATGKQIAKAQTNASGVYYFRNIPMGDYHIEIDEASLPPGLHLTTGLRRFDVRMNEADRLLHVDFGYVGGGSGGGTGGGCGRPVLAWYAPWYGSATRDSTLRHWDYGYHGGISDTAAFDNGLYRRSSAARLFDSRDRDMWEHDILLAWASDVDAFVVDWYGVESYEDAGMRGLLETAQRLWERFGKWGFDFRVIVSYHEDALGSMADNLRYLADSVLVHPAYYHGREGLPTGDWRAYPRPLFVQSLEKRLPADVFRQAMRVQLPDDVLLYWNWDGEDTSLRGYVDGIYPWIETHPRPWDDVTGLEWGSEYLERFYTRHDTLGVSLLTGGVWPGYDERPWVYGSGHWMSRQDTLVYAWTWDKAGAYWPQWVMVQSWNDFNRGTHVLSSVNHAERFVRLTRDHASAWKGGRPCARMLPDEALRVPVAVLDARKRGIDGGVIEAALAAFFAGDYGRALSLLQAAPPEPGIPEPAGSQLVFISGTPSHDKENWSKAVDGNVDGWSGTATVRAEGDGTGPAWAVFGFADNKKYKFEYIVLQTDNGVEDDGYAERQAVRFEVMVSTTDMQPSSFVNIGNWRVKSGEMEWYGLGRWVEARYLKLVILEPRWTSGGWRQVVEFGVNTRQRQGAVAASEGVELAALPVEYKLEQNYPNPFNAETRIRYALPEQSRVLLAVYDLRGREVVRLVDAVQDAGIQDMSWQAGSIPSGIYFLRLRAGAFEQVRKLALMK